VSQFKVRNCHLEFRIKSWKYRLSESIIIIVIQSGHYYYIIKGIFPQYVEESINDQVSDRWHHWGGCGGGSVPSLDEGQAPIFVCQLQIFLWRRCKRLYYMFLTFWMSIFHRVRFAVTGVRCAVLAPWVYARCPENWTMLEPNMLSHPFSGDRDLKSHSINIFVTSNMNALFYLICDACDIIIVNCSTELLASCLVVSSWSLLVSYWIIF
jgi:hypothetical protein